mgnify:CR=1 FL=1
MALNTGKISFEFRLIFELFSPSDQDGTTQIAMISPQSGNKLNTPKVDYFKA